MARPNAVYLAGLRGGRFSSNPVHRAAGDGVRGSRIPRLWRPAGRRFTDALHVYYPVAEVNRRPAGRLRIYRWLPRTPPHASASSGVRGYC